MYSTQCLFSQKTVEYWVPVSSAQSGLCQQAVAALSHLQTKRRAAAFVPREDPEWFPTCHEAWRPLSQALPSAPGRPTTTSISCQEPNCQVHEALKIWNHSATHICESIRVHMRGHKQRCKSRDFHVRERAHTHRVPVDREIPCRVSDTDGTRCPRVPLI